MTSYYVLIAFLGGFLGCASATSADSPANPEKAQVEAEAAIDVAKEAASPVLRIYSRTQGRTVDLARWTLPELKDPKGLNKKSSREEDPVQGDRPMWRGPLLRDLINQSLDQLSLDERAQIDLIILRNAQGKSALVPRSFVVKFPMLLAYERNGKALDEKRGPLYAVPPWTSNSKTWKEDLPLKTYFLSGVSEVELTSYRDRYGGVLLKRRTDPFAMRGESFFVQSCTACHGAGRGPSVPEVIGLGNMVQGGKLPASGSTKKEDPSFHPEVEGLPQFSKRNWRAYFNYLEAYRHENSQTKQ